MMKYEENWKEKSVVRIARSTHELNELISEYSEHGYGVVQISHSESWGNWGCAILFKNPTKR